MGIADKGGRTIGTWFGDSFRVLRFDAPDPYEGSSEDAIQLDGNLDFDNDEFLDADIEVGSEANDLIIGRLYIDSFPGSVFYNIGSLILYSSPERKDNQIVYISDIAFVHTQFALAAVQGDANLTVDDASDLTSDHLLFLSGGGNSEFRRIDSIAGNQVTCIDNLDNGYDVGHGVSSVAEFGNFSIADPSTLNKIYMRVLFPSPQTLSMKFELTLKL